MTIHTHSPAHTTADSAPVLVDIQDLQVTYGDSSPALDGVDLTIRPGEVVALVGESGSGKSTLTKAIIGLLSGSGRVTGGTLTFDGQDLVNASTAEFRRVRGTRIGLVPQDPGASLDPVRTIGYQLTEVFRIHPQKELRSKESQLAEAARLLDLVGVDRPEQRLRQFPHELSGGLKQRVLIAMAFALKPDLLIADEPTSALDVTVQKRVLEVFDRLAKQTGTAVLFVTHDLALATDHASRIVVLQNGRIVEDRDVRAIATDPQHEYTKLLVDAAGQRTPADDLLERALAAAGIKDPVPDLEAQLLPAVEVHGLTKVFGTGEAARRAVDDVSFSVPAGTTFSLVGESGSGKSTTARLILRLLHQDVGTVHVHGQDVSDLTGRQRRDLWKDLQLVYQNPDSALDPRMSIEKIVSEPLDNHRIGTRAERKAKVAELLEQVNLPPRVAAARPAELSGGQRQRVAIARALVLGARTIVLDEALSALDVLTQAQVLDLLDALQRDLGLTYIFISHDLHIVEQISDRVGVMQAGRLVESGTVREIFDSPREHHTQALLAANPGNLLRELTPVH
ncbi:dipeptide ABC transporter ATP-binding protein [Micrococcus terreus]|uniref:Peptide/nickel transport system ATP-binding protein n=1 Tax=Micrococcus terreus TaxID=574650 RepID=A0A1I7MNM3_9MICC|nr:ABC transporter ATP-binding protein [Micrococcus terreus]SFV23514.1 peptide/nickel transport system ATP-binding protein [Micrococcus terreus]